MMKLNLLSCLVFLTVSSMSFAAEEVAKDVTFDAIKTHRENFKEKYIQVEGKVKDLKTIKEGGNKFATFFLADATNSEETISVKVNLSKRKAVINAFTCKNGEFTTVAGRFKPWGTASYLGKMEISESYEFKCSETAQYKAAAPVKVVEKKEKALKKEEVVSNNPKPILLKNTSTTKNQVIDAKGKPVVQGAVLEPGTVIKTGSGSAVQIKYPDGTKVSVGANSKLTTEEGTKSIQSVALQFGKIHAQVQKRESEDLHFKVKTKTATMGVRGTRFFIDVSKTGNTSTHVIEGRVDVAKDDATLSAGKGKHVLKDQFVDVEAGKILEPKHFESAEYLEGLKKEQPELLAFNDQSEEVENIPVAAATTPAKAVKAADCNEKSSLAVFRLAGLGYLAKATTATFTGMVSWNPEMHLIGNWNLGLDLGYTNVKFGSTRSSGFEYALVGAFIFNSSVAAELKVGAQTFMSPASVNGAMGGLALRFGLGNSCVFNHIIVGDDIISLNSTISNIVRLGVGLKF